MPASSAARLISKTFFGGEPLPPDVARFCERFETNDPFVTDILCVSELATSLEIFEAGYGDRVAAISADVAANVRAHRRMFEQIGFFAVLEDGELLGCFRPEPKMAWKDAPIVRLDTEGQYDLLGGSLAEAVSNLAEDSEDGATWLKKNGIKKGRRKKTSIEPKELHDRYYREELGEAPSAPGAPAGDLDPHNPVTWLRQDPEAVRAILNRLKVPKADQENWIDVQKGRVGTVFLHPRATTKTLEIRGVRLGMDSTTVQAKLGPPTKSGQGWIRFDKDGVGVHATIENNAVSLLTVMDIEALPEYLR